MLAMPRIAFLSDNGCERLRNEDHVLADPVRGLVCVADGVGGAPAGEIASGIACRAFAAYPGVAGDIVGAVIAADTAIKLAALANPRWAGMATTLVAAHMAERLCAIAWVGDSRAYLYERFGEEVAHLRQLTSDHSLGHRLIRYLGSSDLEREAVGRVKLKLAQNQSLLLCSDGLTHELTDHQILAILQQHTDPQERAKALVAGALQSGGRDNITVAIASMCGD